MTACVAHLNVARLRHGWEDPRSAGFVDAVPAINALAERSAGFVWRQRDEEALDDPHAIYSLSVWRSASDLRHFVHQTAHGAFLRRRAAWFAPAQGPTHVVWPVAQDARPTLAAARDRLRRLADHGPTADAFDLSRMDLAPREGASA